MDAVTLRILLIVFFAVFIRSAFGFGEALIAVPLLAFSIPIEIAAPLVTLLSITVAAIVVLQDWRQIHLQSLGWLIGPTFLGIPLGIALLTCAQQQFVKAALAIVIAAFSAYSLLRKRPPELHTDSRVWLLGCGFVAGLLGGAYGMNGPPLGYLWGHAALVSAAFPSDAAGLFPASEYGCNGGILAGGTVGASRNSLLRDITRFLCVLRFRRSFLAESSIIAYEETPFSNIFKAARCALECSCWSSQSVKDKQRPALAAAAFARAICR
jgi:hypothetical protein